MCGLMLLSVVVLGTLGAYTPLLSTGQRFEPVEPDVQCVGIAQVGLVVIHGDVGQRVRDDAVRVVART